MSKAGMTLTPLQILCVTDYYLPGFKGGGPIRTIANMRKLLADQVEIAIFTRDRDLGADGPYESIQANEWLDAADGPIFYGDSEGFNAKSLQQAMAGRAFDVLYLNSFFGFRSSIQIVLAFRRVRQAPQILLAPRGEFSQGALAIKAFKKRMFLSLARGLGLYKNVQWHASTEMEKDDILRQFPCAAGKILLAEDPIDIENGVEDEAPLKQTGTAKLAFISRISPMKNLDGLVRMLAIVKSNVELDIFGPVEDEGHWKTCQALIEALPENIITTFQGPLEPDDVSRVFSQFDLFAFPTHGENFGHVIFEALRAGTPVLVSDQTPWKTDPTGAITALPLDDLDAWRQAIEQVAARAQPQQAALRAATLDYARSYAANTDTKKQNIAMFQNAASCDR
ncbi:MAG: glycosyltransferase [Rhodobacteraceae bacterium]|nr:glycosyltransferase [Paracoccaceae bacterium]